MFETERLILRRFNKTKADIDAIYAMRRDAEIMRYIREPQSKAESKNWLKLISSRWESEKIGFCAVVEKSSNELIGWCGLWRLTETNEIEVGYAVARKFWGRGYASEAAARFLEYGFGELNLEKIVAVAREENSGSRRVMEKLGMRFDYIGEFYGRDLVHYTIEKDVYFRNRTSAASQNHAG
jgi:[ribosomal protein S5]-alanine N-acetyltransferase